MEQRRLFENTVEVGGPPNEGGKKGGTRRAPSWNLGKTSLRLLCAQITFGRHTPPFRGHNPLPLSNSRINHGQIRLS